MTTGQAFGYEWEIRINSDPSQNYSAAYLTPAKARELAAVLIDAAKTVERKSKP